MPRCKAHNRAGEQCGRMAAVGYEVCNMHGGKTPRGIAAHQYRHGRYSKYAPAKLLERYHEALDDEELLNLRDEIALLQVRTNELLTRLESGEGPLIWEKLGKEYAELQDAYSARDFVALAEHLNTIGELIRKGAGDWQIWSEIVNLIDARKKVGESERKRIVEAKMILTVEQAMVYATALGQAVFKHVTDSQTRQRIAAEFNVILHGRGTDSGDLAGDVVEVDPDAEPGAAGIGAADPGLQRQGTDYLGSVGDGQNGLVLVAPAPDGRAVPGQSVADGAQDVSLGNGLGAEDV